MHALAKCFLALYLAHLLTDFVFQADRVVARKRVGAGLAYAEHGGIHFLAALLLAGFALPEFVQSLRLYGVVVGLTLIHLGIDWGKLRLIRSNTIEDGATTFFIDQTLHALTVCIAAWLIVRTPIRDLIESVHWFHS
jgi:hypothetical protein